VLFQLAVYYQHRQRESAVPRHNKKNNQVTNMKIQTLLLGVAVTVLTSSAFAGEALLSPRAAGNQIRVAALADAPTTTVAYIAAPTALLSPRAAGNQINVLAGTSTETNPALICRATMPGTPRIVSECSSHATMPGCRTLSAMK
jgi:hypothetical protein